MRTAMVRRVPRALTGFDEVKNSRSSDFSVALRWFRKNAWKNTSEVSSTKQEEYLRGLSGLSGRGLRVPQRSWLVRGRSWRRAVFINDRMNGIIIIEKYLYFLR